MIGSTEPLPKALRQGWANFIRRTADWEWYVTLTFRGYVQERHAMNALRKWARSLAKEQLGAHFSIVYTLERTTGAGIWHFHVLVGPALEGQRRLTRQNIEAAWRSASFHAGFARIERFDVGGNAPHYVVKTAGFDIGIVCPRHVNCRRHAGCVRGRKPF